MVRMRNSLECRLGSKRFNLFSNESCEIYYVVTVTIIYKYSYPYSYS